MEDYSIRDCCNTPINCYHDEDCPRVNPKTRPSREAVMMQVAHAIARRSTCSRRSVGSVIVLEGRISSTGYNGAPSGLPHCDHDCDCGCVSGGVHQGWCKASPACKTAVHAEANAIAFAARHGIATNGSELFTTCSPCIPCAQLIINAGIRTVYAAVRYRDETGIRILGAAGVGVYISE